MSSSHLAPTGEQFTIADSGYVAVITQGGATLRALEFEGRPLVDGFGIDEMPTGGRGQLLMPWVNRIGDGHYEFEGHAYQLPLSEPALHNASHGLVRWAAWSLVEQAAASVSLSYRLMAQSGYPWTLDLVVTYVVGADGLKVTQSAMNLASTPAPYASGAHPYLTLGVQVDSLELTLPAEKRLTTDERKLPTGLVDVTGTEFDFREPRVIGETQWDHAVTSLTPKRQPRTPLLGEPARPARRCRRGSMGGHSPQMAPGLQRRREPVRATSIPGRGADDRTPGRLPQRHGCHHLGPCGRERRFVLCRVGHRVRLGTRRRMIDERPQLPDRESGTSPVRALDPHDRHRRAVGEVQARPRSAAAEVR